MEVALPAEFLDGQRDDGVGPIGGGVRPDGVRVQDGPSPRLVKHQARAPQVPTPTATSCQPLRPPQWPGCAAACRARRTPRFRGGSWKSRAGGPVPCMGRNGSRPHTVRRRARRCPPAGAGPTHASCPRARTAWDFDGRRGRRRSGPGRSAGEDVNGLREAAAAKFGNRLRERADRPRGRDDPDGDQPRVVIDRDPGAGSSPARSLGSDSWST